MKALRPSGDPDAIYAALVERFQEILPADRFRLAVGDGGVIAFEACDEDGRWRSGGAMFGALELRLPLPTRVRLKLYFENRAKALQDFVSGALGQPWPSSLARPQVRVADGAVHIWYGTRSEDEAEVRLRPILKREIGL